jgi:hypothetical protein
MVAAPSALREDYWSTFALQAEDVEFIYNHLLEIETPLTSLELTTALVEERIRQEKLAIERQRSSGGAIYFPKEHYSVNQKLVFPGLGWRKGTVIDIRPGNNPDIGAFEVIKVTFEGGEVRELAAGLAEHALNNPPELVQEDASLNPQAVMATYGPELAAVLEAGLQSKTDFVRIAGRWFPRALLVDVNAGHLNLAEAVLDVAGGGPFKTNELLKQVELPSNVNPKLVEFSLDLALQEDPRFDEVGPAGQVLWFLNRLEPEEVRQTPFFLRYSELEYDRSLLTPAMQALERELDDEFSPSEGKYPALDEVQVRLIFPHWRSGTLPLSPRMRHLFPTAYESPRIRFMLVDGDSGQKFPGWVVRQQRYVYGLSEWYQSRGLMPGSLVLIRHGERPGEVVVKADVRRPGREWMRTVLVGSDGGIVFAMLKQTVMAAFDDRMTIAIPDVEALDKAWQQSLKERTPFEKVVANTVRELAKLNPQSHVHASELYAAVNIVRRCPPGPILALLASRPWFIHVGDQHFRFDDSDHS